MMEKPDWLTLPAPSAEKLDEMKKLLEKGCLHTVCESADCPNIGECFANHTCTFMILGDICTRNCRFCAVQHGRPHPVDMDEPKQLTAAVKKLGLKHVVITTVTRDDLPDGGAGQFVAVLRALHQEAPEVSVEVLISDLKGSAESLAEIITAKPDVINHNVETVPRLYPMARPQARYFRSLELLHRVNRSNPEIITKSGLMLGLGESKEEVIQVMQDLIEAGCQVLTLGQYLRPSLEHLPVVRYIEPEEFQSLQKIGEEMGFRAVSSGPLVRSSYNAGKVFQYLSNKKRKG